MVDFRVHDGFPNHPKTLGLSLEAVGLWTLAGCWCARYLTDGYIPSEAIAQYTGRSRAPLAELVDHNLLQRIEGGYLFADWLQYQRSRSELEKTVAHNRSRQARYRAKRRDQDPET
jgi:hypothetical protein